MRLAMPGLDRMSISTVLRLMKKGHACVVFDTEPEAAGAGPRAMQAAVDSGVPVQVPSAALVDRFALRSAAALANKMMSAMRSAFGGHDEVKAEGSK